MKKLLSLILLSVSFTTHSFANGCDSSTIFLGHFNDAGATFSDANCQGNKPITVTPTDNATQTGINPKFSRTLLLDGSGDYLTLTDDPRFDFGTGDFTIDFWASWDATGGNYFLFSRGGDPANNFNLFHSANAFYFYLMTATVINGAAFTPTLDTWYHIQIVREGSNSPNVNMYVDGVSIAAVGSAANIADTNPIVIGWRSAATYFPGQIDEFRLSNVARRPVNGPFTPPTAQYCSGCENVGGVA